MSHSHYSEYDGGGGGRGGGGRWDSERFGREHAERYRGPPVVERDRFEEHDVYEPRRGSGRFEEKDTFFEEDRYGPPARRSRGGLGRYHDDDADSMVREEDHYRQSSRDYEPPPPARRPGGRPVFVRRQSSLDTFDRKPMPRYGDRMREPPETIVIPNSQRRRSPPRYVERDFEDIRISEPDFYGDEGFRGYRERERSTVRRRYPEHDLEEEAVRKEEIMRKERDDFEDRRSLEFDKFSVREEVEEPYPRRGKTKMPRRLVNKRAILELGYPFEEEVRTLGHLQHL